MPPKIRLTQDQCSRFIQEYRERLERGETTIVNPITQKNIKIYPYNELSENHVAYKILQHCSEKHSLTLETSPGSSPSSPRAASKPIRAIRTREDAMKKIKEDVPVFIGMPSFQQLIQSGDGLDNDMYSNAIMRRIISCCNLVNNLYDHNCNIDTAVLNELRECWFQFDDIYQAYRDIINMSDNRSSNTQMHNLMVNVRQHLYDIFYNQEIYTQRVSDFIVNICSSTMPHTHIRGPEKENVLAYVSTVPRPKQLSFFVLDIMFNDLVSEGMRRSIDNPPYMFLLQYYSQDDIISALCTLIKRIQQGSAEINGEAVDGFIDSFMKRILQEFKHIHADKNVKIGFPDVVSYFTRKLLSEKIQAHGLNSFYFTKANINSFFVKKNLKDFKESNDMRYSEFNKQVFIRGVLDRHDINLGLSKHALSRDIDHIYMIDTFDDCTTVRALIGYYTNPATISRDALLPAMDIIHANIEELQNENTFAFVTKLLREFLHIDMFEDRMRPYFIIFGSLTRHVLDGHYPNIYSRLLAEIFYIDLEHINTRDDFIKKMKSMSFIHHAGLYDGMVNSRSPENFNIIENLTLTILYCLFKRISIKRIYMGLFQNMMMLSADKRKHINERMYQYNIVFSAMKGIYERFVEFDYSDILGFNKKTSQSILKEFQQGIIVPDYSPSSSSPTSSELNIGRDIINKIGIADLKALPQEYKGFVNKMIKVSNIILPQKNCNTTNSGIAIYFRDLYKRISSNNPPRINVVRGREFEQAYSIMLSANKNSPIINIFYMLTNIVIVYDNERGIDHGGLWNEFYTNAAQQLMVTCFRPLDDSDRYILKDSVRIFDGAIDYHIVGILMAFFIIFNIKLHQKLSYNLLLHLIATEKSNDDSITYLQISRNYQSILYMLDTNNTNYIRLFNHPIDEINMFIGKDPSSSPLETPSDYIKYINKTIKESLGFDKRHMRDFKRGFNRMIDPERFKKMFGNEPLVMFNLSESISLGHITQDDIKNVLLKKQEEYLRSFIRQREYNDGESTSALSILDKYKSIMQHTDDYEYLPIDKIEELRNIYPNVPTNYEEFIDAFMFHISGFKSIRSDLPYKLVCSRFNNGIEYHTCFCSIDIPIILSKLSRMELLYLMVSDVSASRNNVA